MTIQQTYWARAKPYRILPWCRYADPGAALGLLAPFRQTRFLLTERVGLGHTL